MSRLVSEVWLQRWQLSSHAFSVITYLTHRVIVHTLHKGDTEDDYNTSNSRNHYSYQKIALPYLPSVAKAEKKYLKAALVFDKQKAKGEYKKYRRL